MNCDAKFVLHCSSASRSRIYRQSHCRDDQSVGRWSRFNASTCSRAAAKREFRQVEGNSESKMRASLVDLKFPDWIPVCDARSRYKIKVMTAARRLKLARRARLQPAGARTDAPLRSRADRARLLSNARAASHAQAAFDPDGSFASAMPLPRPPVHGPALSL